MNNMRINIVLIIISSLMLISCSNKPESSAFTGDYRYYAGISELFDCANGLRYFVAKKGITEEIEKTYLSLHLKEKEDAYIEVEGYLQQESPEESLVPSTVFIPTKLINFDTTRGCDKGHRQGL